MPQNLEEYTEQQIPVDLSDDGVWGPLTISTLNLFGRALAGVESVSVTSANVTLDTTQAQRSVIVATGNPVADRTIFLPVGKKRRYRVRSALSPSTRKLIVQVTGGTGLSVTCYPGSTIDVYTDGTDVYATGPASAQNGGALDLRGVLPGMFFSGDELAGFARIGNGVFVYPGGVSGAARPWLAFFKGNTAVEPALAFSSSTFSSYTSGLFFPDGNTLAFSLGGSEKFRANTLQILIGRTSGAENVQGALIDYSGKLTIERTNAGCIVINRMGSVGSGSSGNGRVVQFHNTMANEAGSVRIETANTVSYTTTSDERRKTDIRPVGSLWTMIHAVEPKLFKWRGGDGRDVLGFIAQEAVGHWRQMEGAISGDPSDPANMMGADYGRITPMLLWAVQDLDRRLRSRGK